MCFNNGHNDGSCLWLIIIVLLIVCCCGSMGGNNCRSDCEDCRRSNNCGRDDDCTCC